MSKVLFIGPYPPLITGQSLAFKEAYDHFPYPKYLIDTNKYPKAKIFSAITYIFSLVIFVLSLETKIIYFTGSRSTVGFLRELPIFIISRLFNIKVVNHLHGLDFKPFYQNSNSIKFLIRWCYKGVNTSIVLLPKMAEQFENFPKMKKVVVSNAYSKEFEKYEVSINNKMQQILFLSNIMQSKGILDFLDSLPQILSKHKNATVVIAGSPMGDYCATKEEISNSFGNKLEILQRKFPDRIRYAGSIFGEEKIIILKSSSIFVLPTFHRTEAFPISIIEAMRFGNAIITTNINYLPDIVTKKNGFVIQKRNIEELVEKLDLLLSDVNLLRQFQYHNISDAKARFSSDNYLNGVHSTIISLTV